jgi:dGTPase
MTLAPYAADPAASRGREFASGDATGQARLRGPRSDFQRDRDRIIHSIAFRRLRSKTQVFIAPDGDHYRTRLTHSIEVAQIARVLARALGLNEDLTEALSLAHDIGHPPFGHAGEKALSEAMLHAGGYDHNAHGLRVLTRLESPYPGHDGLNLTWETLEGMAKHNGPVSEPNWALEQIDEAFPLELDQWPSLEAQIANLADDIAYDNHDIDDGLRAGFLQLDDLLALDFVAERWRDVERRFPGAPQDRLLRELIRGQIGVMVNDVLAETGDALTGIETIEDVRAQTKPLVQFSPAMKEQERQLKSFMYEKLYFHPDQLETAERSRDVIARLFAAYSQDNGTMPAEWRGRLPDEEPQRSRHIADFIAGMTDRFAIGECARIYGKVPDGLSNV